MKIFIRADGGNSIGFGHIMRILVLAKELNKTNKVIFLCKSSNVKDKDTYIENKEILSNVNNKFKHGNEKVEDLLLTLGSMDKDYNTIKVLNELYSVI